MMRTRGEPARAAAVAGAALLLAACGSSREPIQADVAKICPVPGARGSGLPFETDPAALAAALRCHPAATASERPTVLLVHGTALDADANFSWNYVPALTARGWPVCTVDLPAYAQGDIQLAAEYVVHAIRETARSSQGLIKVVGFSQGGMLPRWALRYWPDTRDHVDELIALAGSNHGTVVANAACAAGCPEAQWQQRWGSAFITALNRDFETVPEVDYSNLYTQADQIVQPNLDDSGSTSLAPGPNVANIAVQEVCPGHVADHLAMGSHDPVAFALVLDALENEGPAQPWRVPVSVCAQAFMPGVTADSFPAGYSRMLQTIADASAAPRVSGEPPLRCYTEGR